MSIITSADFNGAKVMGEVVVRRVRLELDGWVEAVGEDGCVRSKPVDDEWSQKFDAEPTRALRGGSGGVERGGMVLGVVEGACVWRSCMGDCVYVYFARCN